MPAVEFILFLFSTVIVSSLLSRLIPYVTLPLVQIALGVILALVIGPSVQVVPDPELFLVLFIAPLLFNEGKNMNRLSIWNNRRMIFSLALGLVIVLVLSIGFIMHWLIPSASLAACFALGAALGPTDSVAVLSLSKSVSLDENQRGILSGECLINDASGIVSFQFAIAAAMTGTFSIIEAGISFAFTFLGGIILGTIIGYITTHFIRLVRNIGLESLTFHVSIEIILPFLTFLVGEAVGVSGILAVVACAVVFNLAPKDFAGPSTSRMNIVSSSVWQMITYFLNGLVFVMLGLQLPESMQSVIESPRFPNINLFEYVLMVVVILIAIRFIWIIAVKVLFPEKRQRAENKHAKRLTKSVIKDALLLTFAGPKGAITLSIAFSLPIAISGRSLLIFIASGAIICTLVLSNIFVPLLAPTKKKTSEQEKQEYAKARIAILRGVIEKLSQEQDEEEKITKRTGSAYRTVMEEYSSRIKDIKDKGHIDDDKNIALRIQSIHWEEEHAIMLMERGEADEDTAYNYLHKMNKMVSRIQNKNDITWLINNSIRGFRTFVRGIQGTIAEKLPNAIVDTEKETAKQQSMRLLQEKCILYVLKRLQTELTQTNYPTEDVNNVITEYRNMLLHLQSSNPSVTQIIKTDNKVDEIKRHALKYENEMIDKVYEEEKITREQRNQLRQSIHLMELDVNDVI